MKRNSRAEVFCKKSVLEKSVFFLPATLLKNTFWRRCFPVNFTKFLRTRTIIESLRVVASGFTKYNQDLAIFDKTSAKKIYFMGHMSCLFYFDKHSLFLLPTNFNK